MDRENLVTCPYNKFHQIRNSRIRYHLLKCGKNHPNVELLVCPYNATHLFPEAQRSRHLVECPDRRIVDMQKYNEPLPGRHGYLANPPFYGSSRKFEPVPEPLDEQEIAISQNEQNPHISINTTKRNENLREQFDRRHSSQEGRRHSSIDSEMVASLGGPSTASSSGIEAYRPLRVYDDPSLKVALHRLLPEDQVSTSRIFQKGDEVHPQEGDRKVQPQQFVLAVQALFAIPEMKKDYPLV